MIIRCTKCSTEFALDPSQVGPEGVTLRCSVCSHMFHAEPDPDAEAAPWKLATVEKHLFTLPDLRHVLEHIEDGRLRPDDQISRTGQAWLKLGEMPEFSSLFIGAEGLPRVYKAAETSPVTDLGPPPAFGAGVDEVRREETVRFNVNTMTGVSSSSSTSRLGRSAGERGQDFDPLPAPPEFDTPVSRRGRAPGVPEPRAFPAPPVEPRASRPAPASMLEAVTNAVADDRGRGVDVPESGEASRSRSQPILVADLARAAAASAEKAVQAVDGQRARERAERSERSERSTGTFTGSMSRVEPPRPVTSATVNASRDVVRPEGKPGIRRDSDRPVTASIAAARQAESAALAAAVTSAVPAHPPQRNQTADLAGLAALANREPRPADPTPAPVAVEPALGEPPTELTSPPGVVIVKMAEPRRSSGALWAMLGVLGAVGIVFGVPSIREWVLSGGSAPVTRAPPEPEPVRASSDLPTQELAQARTAMRNLGLKESNKVEAALQRVIDDPQRSPEAVTQARLAQAELVLMRALACKIAVTIEPSALDGQAQTRAVEDPVQAADLLAAVGPTADPEQLKRVQALQALVAGQPPSGELPPGSEELAALIKGAPLWRGEVRSPPAGLITSLQRIANPSTLSQSVLALALWRSGDIDGAQALLRGIIERINDQPAAGTILAAIDRQNLVNENGDPEVAVPPSEPEPVPQVEPEPGTNPDAKTNPVARPSSAPSNLERAEVMVSTGCQKVRQGDAAGIKQLLEAVDRHPETLKNFNLCFCLGTGFARQGSHEAALTWYRRSLTLAPNNRDAVAGAARSAEQLGRTGEAVNFYKKLLTLDPGNAGASAYLSKHDSAHEPPGPQPSDDPPGELMPIKRKNQ